MDCAGGRASRSCARSRTGASDTHVFTLHAELEGQKLLPQFEFLLRALARCGLQLAPMRDYHRGLDAPEPSRA